MSGGDPWACSTMATCHLSRPDAITLQVLDSSTAEVLARFEVSGWGEAALVSMSWHAGKRVAYILRFSEPSNSYSVVAYALGTWATSGDAIGEPLAVCDLIGECTPSPNRPATDVYPVVVGDIHPVLVGAEFIAIQHFHTIVDDDNVHVVMHRGRATVLHLGHDGRLDHQTLVMWNTPNVVAHYHVMSYSNGLMMLDDVPDERGEVKSSVIRVLHMDAVALHSNKLVPLLVARLAAPVNAQIRRSGVASVLIIAQGRMVQLDAEELLDQRRTTLASDDGGDMRSVYERLPVIGLRPPAELRLSPVCEWYSVQRCPSTTLLAWVSETSTLVRGVDDIVSLVHISRPRSGPTEATFKRIEYSPRGARLVVALDRTPIDRDPMCAAVSSTLPLLVPALCRLVAEYCYT
jgi:hypothetical protein